jgi:hypothetical protein
MPEHEERRIFGIPVRTSAEHDGRRFLGFPVGDRDPAEAFAEFLLRPVRWWRGRRRGLR